jgi:hypothetical protein
MQDQLKACGRQNSKRASSSLIRTEDYELLAVCWSGKRILPGRKSKPVIFMKRLRQPAPRIAYFGEKEEVHCLLRRFSLGIMTRCRVVCAVYGSAGKMLLKGKAVVFMDVRHSVVVCRCSEAIGRDHSNLNNEPGDIKLT